jgi:hypothetical protein
MRNALNPSDLITPDNWQEAARAAVAALRGEVRACVAWEPPAARRLALRVAGQPLAGAPGGQRGLVELRWWDSLREKEAACEADSPQHAGDPKPHKAGDPGWAGPVVSTRAEVIGLVTDLFAGLATVGTLAREVQVAVLEVRAAAGNGAGRALAKPAEGDAPGEKGQHRPGARDED